MIKRACILLVTGATFIFLPGCSQEKKVQALLEQAEAAQVNENYSEAINLYSEVLHLDPKSAAALTGRGTCLVTKNEMDKAMDDLTQAIWLAPTNRAAHEMLGYVQIRKEEWAAAITNFTVALTQKPDDGLVLKARGNAYYMSRYFTNAINDLTAASNLRTNDDGIYVDRADVYWTLDETNQALADYDQALRLNPENAKALYGRGRTYFQIGDYFKATQDFNQVIDLKPKADLAYNRLAWLLATCPDARYRDGKRAIELATRACSLTKWRNYALVDTLAAAYAEAGDYTNAVRYQKEASSMNGIPADNLSNVVNRIELYRQHKPYRVSNQRYD